MDPLLRESDRRPPSEPQMCADERKANRNFRQFFDAFFSLWERFVVPSSEPRHPTARSLAIFLSGIFLTATIHSLTGFYFASFTVLTAIVISVFAGPLHAVLLDCAMVLICDYFFIEPRGGLLNSPYSREHFFIVCPIGLFAVLMTTLFQESNRRTKAALERTEQAKAEAELANLTKSRFLANMCHEIRTPLSAVLGYAELVTDPKISGDDKQKFIKVIKRNAELVSHLINDVLDLSKVEAGRLTINRRDTSLEEILLDLRTFMRMRALDKGNILSISVQPGTPEVFVTDPLRLRQILLNLVGNANKFTYRGRIEIEVKMASRPTQLSSEKTDTLPTADLLIFEISDTGEGIRAEDIPNLFMAFSQSHAEGQKRHSGTGLGLALSKKLANLLGGDVRLVSSAKNKGTTFEVVIDSGVSKIVESQIQEELAPSPHDVKRPLLNGTTVLLVDDSTDNQELIRLLLEIEGATVEVLNDGKEAVDLLLPSGARSAERPVFDVILMDIEMPRMNGFEATRLLRRSGYEGEIVALTAHALNDEIETYIKQGFDRVLPKPIERKTLIKTIDEIAHKTSRFALSPGANHSSPLESAPSFDQLPQ